MFDGLKFTCTPEDGQASGMAHHYEQCGTAAMPVAGKPRPLVHSIAPAKRSLFDVEGMIDGVEQVYESTLQDMWRHG